MRFTLLCFVMLTATTAAGQQAVPVVGDPSSLVYHRTDVAHAKLIVAPATFGSADSAVTAGFRPCPVCFFPQPARLRSMTTELTLAGQIEAQIRMNYWGWEDQTARERVRGALNRVLANWPFPLMGYTYRVGLLDSSFPNIIAVPTGRIYVTRGLIETLESDLELEALLAHQVTHVERRHALRSYESAREIRAITGVVGRLVSGSTGIDLKPIADQAERIVLQGYTGQQERRADSFMLGALPTPQHRSATVRIYQKLADLAAGPGRFYPLLNAHLPNADRVRRIESSGFHVLNVLLEAGVPRTNGMWASLQLSAVTWSEDGAEVFGYLRTRGSRSEESLPRELYAASATPAERRRWRLTLQTPTGETRTWSLNLLLLDRGLLAVEGQSGETEGIEAFLAGGIAEATLEFRYTTVPGGNALGETLQFLAGPGFLTDPASAPAPPVSGTPGVVMPVKAKAAIEAGR